MTENYIKNLLKKEQKYLNHFFDHIDLEAVNAVFQSLLACKGLIVLTGVGKSGLVAKKAAVTMTSTGTRAIFLSPVNALHGDLGILKSEDVFVFFSKSGESSELFNLIPFIRNRGIKIIGIISKSNSRLAKAVDELLPLPLERELCPFDMAPTTSTTMQAIIGDILAVALMLQKKFTMTQFAESHPAGQLGKRATIKVKDLMIQGNALPVCRKDDKLVDILVELSNKLCGCVLILSEDRRLLGIFTDGDLRRTLQTKGSEVLKFPMENLMNCKPRTIGSDVLAWEALKEMESDQKHPIMILPVIDNKQKVIGLIKMHDIVQSGI